MNIYNKNVTQRLHFLHILNIIKIKLLSYIFVIKLVARSNMNAYSLIDYEALSGCLL